MWNGGCKVACAASFFGGGITYARRRVSNRMRARYLERIGTCDGPCCYTTLTRMVGIWLIVSIGFGGVREVTMCCSFGRGNVKSISITEDRFRVNANAPIKD